MATISSQAVATQTETDDERLHELFWNRAALKKQFAGLRRENQRLKEQLKKQESVTSRAKKQLEQLETTLTVPEQAANAIVFYQLRGVWYLCHKKLLRMSTEFIAHQREREQKKITDRFEASRRISLESFESHIAKAQQRMADLQQELKAIHDRHDNLRGFWNYFKRRELRTGTGPLRTALSDISDQVAQYTEARQAKEAETAPVMGEVSHSGQRKINLALIAIAQELYLHFASRGISGMAREASVRALADAKYGDISACRALTAHIEERVKKLQDGHDLVANVRNRTQFLGKLANYRDKKDRVPVASSFAQIPLIGPDGFEKEAHKSAPVNVLAEEYWDITRVLLDGVARV